MSAIAVYYSCILAVYYSWHSDNTAARIISLLVIVETGKRCASNTQVKGHDVNLGFNVEK